MSLVAWLLALSLALPGFEVVGRGVDATDIERQLPAAVQAVEARLGPVPWGEVRVVVTTFRDPLTRNRAPEWAAGYAVPERGIVVLRMDRIGTYPYSSAERVLVHELSHVAVARRRGPGQVPRWFDEGLAMSTAHEMGLGDAFRLSTTLILTSRIGLSQLDQAFAGDRSQVQSAYALALAFVSWLEERHGPNAPREILDQVAAGVGFEAAVARVAGQSLAALESQWKDDVTYLYRWLPIVTSSVTLWIGITLLAFVAWARKRRRVRELQARWAIEEGELTSVDTSGPWGPN